MISITMMFSFLLEMFFVITMFHSTHLITNAFIPVVMPTNMKSRTIVQQQQQQNPEHQRFIKSSSSTLYMATASEDKAAIQVTGEALEMMLQEWDQPLVVDAYATWCGPCLLMAPEFEEAAKELKGKVRFVKLDTDKEENMAARLNIMGLPTLLFLDQFKDETIVEFDEEKGSPAAATAKAVLKGRIEGAMRKNNIIDLCNHYFFDGPEPKLY